jgi:hypothetical protein
LNGATCIPRLSGNTTSKSCSCRTGFGGSNCETTLVLKTDCSSNPCQNGGKCTNSYSGYRCACPKYYSGTNCQTVSTTDCFGKQFPLSWRGDGICQDDWWLYGEQLYLTCNAAGYDGGDCPNPFGAASAVSVGFASVLAVVAAALALVQ